ncbi:MAG: hypothetical protein Ct9H300mP16_04900 [Pseudomonadota bacterium]|nr:MAG: hypothetical protein Ct9H300mP16_04900 [Pseudomonadota bacterium]
MGKVNETMSYSAEGQELKGYLAFDDEAGPGPGVMVIHEWWGLENPIYANALIDWPNWAIRRSHSTCTVMAGRGKVLTNPVRS